MGIDPFRTVAQLACERDGDLPVWVRTPKSGQGLYSDYSRPMLYQCVWITRGLDRSACAGGWILDMRIASGQICDMTGTRHTDKCAFFPCALCNRSQSCTSRSFWNRWARDTWWKMTTRCPSIETSAGFTPNVRHARSNSRRSPGRLINWSKSFVRIAAQSRGAAAV